MANLSMPVTCVSSDSEDYTEVQELQDKKLVFENLTKSDLVCSSGRIIWSENAIRTIYRFCAQHQISARNLPNPEQLALLLQQLNAPELPVAACENAAKRLLSALRSRVCQAKVPAALQETKNGSTWTCVWAGYTKRWFEDEAWNGQVTTPSNVTPEEIAPRPVIPRRHERGDTRLIQELLHFKATERTNKKNGSSRSNSQSRTRFASAELEVEVQTAKENGASANTGTNSSISVLEARLRHVQRDATEKAKQAALHAASRIQELEAKVKAAEGNKDSSNAQTQASISALEVRIQQVQKDAAEKIKEADLRATERIRLIQERTGDYITKVEAELESKHSQAVEGKVRARSKHLEMALWKRGEQIKVLLTDYHAVMARLDEMEKQEKAKKLDLENVYNDYHPIDATRKKGIIWSSPVDDWFSHVNRNTTSNNDAISTTSATTAAVMLPEAQHGRLPPSPALSGSGHYPFSTNHDGDSKIEKDGDKKEMKKFELSYPLLSGGLDGLGSPAESEDVDFALGI